MKQRKFIRFGIILIFLAALAACGGPSGSSSLLPSDNQGGGNNPPPSIFPPATPPPVPVITTANTFTDRVELDWSDESSREDGFIVERDGVEIATTAKNISVWTDTNVQPGATYCYAVRSYNVVGKSNASLLECATIPLPPPPINHPPTISSVSATPASVETGKQSSIACSASDPDNDPLSYSWSANAGTISGSGSTIQWTTPLSAGNYTVQCSVSDGKGGSGVKSVNVSVTVVNEPPPPTANHAPVISSIIAIPSTIETGKQSSISCSASDSDNDPLSYSWSANAGTISGSGSTIQWTAPAQAGTYAIQCSVSDSQGGSRSGVTDIIVTDPIPVQTKWQLPSDLSIRSLATDQATGEVYAAGMTTTAPTDIFLAKFNPDGTLAWEKRWGTAGYDFDWDMTVFEGNVFLLWNQNGVYGIGDGDEMVSQFDADGNIVKVIKIGDYAIYKIVVDSSTIYFDGLKMDREGTNWVWVALPWVNYSLKGPAVYNGTAYYTGQSLASTDVGGAEGYTAAVDASNNVVWTSRWGKTSTTIGYGIAIHATNGVYTIGPGVALRHDFYGNILWTQQISVCMYSNVRVVVDDTGIYIINGCGLTKITNDGAVAWQTSVTGRSLALFNNVLFVADDSNIIRRYDAFMGSTLP